jgi:uncharacterized membrane protein
MRTPHNPLKGPHPRLLWIDALRGLAILFMIPANLSPLLVEPHALWFRIISSFAAPVFVMLSAGMVELTASRHDLRYFVRRGAIVLGAGMAIDVLLWRILPWTSIDVLYVIGVGIPLVALLARARTRVFLTLALACFAAAFALQAFVSYHPEALQIFYLEDLSMPGGLPRLLQSWFVDGWFPYFPWLGYAFLGAVFFRHVFVDRGHTVHLLMAGGGALLAALGFTLLFVPIAGLRSIASGAVLASREGYCEIFYPATLGYVLASIGMVVVFAYIVRHVHPSRPIRVLAFFGRYSMLVYILHQVLGEWGLKQLLGLFGVEQIASGPVFTLAVLTVIAVIALVCRALTHWKHRHPVRSVVLQVLIGKN